MLVNYPNTYTCPTGVSVTGAYQPHYASILTPEALTFLMHLHRQFNARRIQLLAARQEVQKQLDKGALLQFLPETAAIRASDWKVVAPPTDLLDRRIEITGPVDRKMVINALNSGANVFMADFEDSNTPSWTNNLDGHINLRDANLGTIDYHAPNGKQYTLVQPVANLFVRPRGWHLPEKHILVDGEITSGSLTDFGLYFFHNVHTRRSQHKGLYLYLPKIEHYLEARLWNDVFVFAQNYMGVPQSTIRATVLIETIPAAFQMDEILWELKDHSAGLNCGRWDYIFSIIKRFKNNPQFVMPDRAQVTMTAHCMNSYSQLLIRTCHRRGIHAMGGMSAQIPIKNDAQANVIALEKVQQDKQREAQNGHDGTWVAHPGLVPLAKNVFDQYMPTPNQISSPLPTQTITAKDLLTVPTGTITEAGVRENIHVAILYLESWLRGVGCAALYHKMEDAATAEISRVQLWQWIRHQAKMDDGRTVSVALYHELLPSELVRIQQYVGHNAYQNGRFEQAINLLHKMVLTDECPEFLTLDAYQLV